MRDRKDKIRATSNKRRATKKGLTLLEMTAVVSATALLAVLALPAIRTLFNSMASAGSAQAMISAALASARAIAASHQHYAGVRFQKAYNPDNPDPLDADQYMIFIIHDTQILPGVQRNLGCRAVEGIKPIKLPNTVGVMDSGRIKEEIGHDPGWELSGDPAELTDLTAFSIIFSPSGKLVIHSLWVRNREGVSDNSSNDDIFNTQTNIRDNGIGMFLQDGSASAGLPIENSRNSFIIYEKEEFRQAYQEGRAYSGYLYKLVPEAIYINPYTGTIISTD